MAGAFATLTASLEGASARFQGIGADVSKLTSSADKLGLSFTNLSKDTSLLGASLGGAKTQLLAVNGDVTNVASTAGKLGHAFAQVSRDVGLNGLAKMAENASGKLATLAHASEIVQQRLSQASPAVEKLIGPLSRAVDGGQHLAAALKSCGVDLPPFVDSSLHAAGALVQLGNDFGPLLMNASQLIKDYAPALLGFMAEMTATALPGLSAAFTALGVAIMETPVGWIAAGIALIAGAAYLIYEYWTPIKHFFASVWDGVVGAFKWAWNNIVPWIPGWNLVKLIVDHWGSIVGFFQSIWSRVTGVFRWARNFVIGLWDIVVQKLTAVWRPVANFFGGIWNRVVGTFRAAWGHVKTSLAQLGQGAVGLLTSAWSKVTGFFKGIWDGVTGVFSAAWDKIKPIVDAIAGFGKWILDVTGISGAWNALTSDADAVEKHGEAIRRSAQPKPGVHTAPPMSAPPKSTPPVSTALHMTGRPVSGPVHATGPVQIARTPAQVAKVVHVKAAAAPKPAPQIPVKGSADIRVHFENAPPGTKVGTRVTGRNPPRVETGVAFAH